MWQYTQLLLDNDTSSKSTVNYDISVLIVTQNSTLVFPGKECEM